MEQIRNFIHGEWQVTASRLPKHSPATGEVIYELPDSNADDVSRAVDSATQAFKTWSKTSVKERAAFLHKIADGIEKRLDAFAHAETMDVGKPLWLSKEIDIPRAVSNFRFFADHILQVQEQTFDTKGTSINHILRQPLGVAGLITPWNLPIYLLSWKIAPALAAGNTAVCKPSELTSQTAYLLTHVFNEAGLPKGVCNIVFGKGSPAGDTLVKHPFVPMISFTGGTKTGAYIQSTAAPLFKKTSLELGGKNPAILCEDADLEKALPFVIKSSFLNQGQICLGCERIFVHEKQYDRFVEMFKTKTVSLKVGDPMEENTYMGPLVSKEHLQKVKQCVSTMIQDGGRMITGDEPLNLPESLGKGYFMRPVIITDLPSSSSMHQNEIFGPIVAITPYKNEDEVIQNANDTQYGLCASVYSKDVSKAKRIASQLDVGTVWINTWLKRDLRVPFGGMKHSGLGREGGDYSFDFYTEAKTVCVSLDT